MPDDDLIEEELTHSVIGAFYEVYNGLRFGLGEHAYQMALERELRWRGHDVGREVYVPIYYKGEELTRQRIDMLVDGRLVVETQATVELHKSAHRQIYSYLCASRLQVGLLLHFGPEPAFYRSVHTNPPEA
jgi:GxxExxY protein